ncbi:MAG TPA: DUF1223 domain-containing protein [Methylotenera sp.]|nr:DUF1223 domain-containing protein [Methylotenera sp.]
MLQRNAFLFGLSLLFGASQPAFAAECSAKSGAATVPLLELYTSEGCSSCPPADKWISSIKTDKVTPLAFHVDYWDYIGWKDKFSKAQYSDRQRKTAAFGGAGFVYTPQFVMNGRDFKGWDNSRLNEKIESNQKLSSRVNLSLNALIEANGGITLKTSAQAVKPADAKNIDVFIALYENKLVSQVKAGENNGRELKHDYVVSEFFGAYQISNRNEFTKNFTLSPEWSQRDAGAVIFVQNSQTGEVLQSLALKFCGS